MAIKHFFSFLKNKKTSSNHKQILIIVLIINYNNGAFNHIHCDLEEEGERGGEGAQKELKRQKMAHPSVL